MDGTSSITSSGGPWLPAALQLHVFSLLPPNDRALSCRFVSPDAASSLSGPENCTASLSQPLPPHAVCWAVESGQSYVQQLPFRHKVRLLCTAAASGSEVNLEVALALLQPSIFPEVLQSRKFGIWIYGAGGYCLGEAAAKAGHPQLLPSLVRRFPWLISPGGVLKAAARHCDLAGLQVAWKALQHGFGNSSECSGLRPVLNQDVLHAAAESFTPDAVAKMEWMLQTAMKGARGGREGGCPSCRLQLSTAVAAARSGDLGRLRWLRDQGCPMGRRAGQGALVGEVRVLETALRHADLAVAQWLVDEAGCGLPAAGGGGEVAAEEGDRAWIKLLRAAADSPDTAAKWQWLHGRGGPSVAGAEPGLVKELTLAAVEAGQVEAVQYLLSVLGAGKVLAVGREAFIRAAGWSGSIPVAECLQQAGIVFSHQAYSSAEGNLPFVRWLALEARVSAAAITRIQLTSWIAGWPRDTPAHSRDLLAAVQLLAGAGFSDWCDTGHTVYFAAHRGEFDLARFLLNQGAPLNTDNGTVEAAAEAGCVPLLELLSALSGGFKPSGVSLRSLYIQAAEHGDLATLDALRRLGAPWGVDGVLAKAVKGGCGEAALRWLVEHGAPVGSPKEMEAAVASAVERGGLRAEVAAWLRGLAAGGSGTGSDGEEW